MPASMISAPTGGRPKVIGKSIAMVATVPMPGRTPTKVPTRAPSRQNRTLYGLDATWKPIQRFARRSDMAYSPQSVEARTEVERQVEQVDEQQHAKQSHQRRGDRAFDPAHFRRSEDRDHERQKCCGDQAERPDHGGKAENSDNDEGWTAYFVLFDRRPVDKDTIDGDGGAEGCKNKREQPRRCAGAEGKTALPRYLCGRDQGQRRQHGEGDAAIKVPRSMHGH